MSSQQVIWKFVCPRPDRVLSGFIDSFKEFTLRVPAGGAPVSFQLQNGDLTLWMRLDVSGASTLVTRRFIIVGTGREFGVGGKPWEYVGTVQDKGSCEGLVWHLLMGPVET